MTPTTSTDRAAALRAAVRRVVATRGLHGASMSLIAAEAGVATGTAYNHYADKDDLVLSAYAEAKRELGRAAVEASEVLADDADHRARFVALWLGAHRHLRATPTDARFLLQVDASPEAAAAHERVLADGEDRLVRELADGGWAGVLVDLEPQVLYELTLAPAVRLAAREPALDDDTLEAVANACFTAVTTPRP